CARGASYYEDDYGYYSNTTVDYW
nr:immunoglobulin heavy chain junction region [Macaca mulatta]MOV54961.1 immunoglobulin heavy chain junction region [Macaca mulatta]MOV56721.1 immunoglobulin heavy chain junction region [Macaca mulatta]MOV57131.1 immunoglobulin heavy chain junction region [Macaca mulatta]